ncbi:MAG: sigma-70 family RNA polymerase sigma factor [Tissierellia bacterium]|nr:sigma-70 family RNA polymerase sigma factor [Tissierellia bacterium]
MILIFLLYLNALSYQERIDFEKLFAKYKNYMYAIALHYHKNKFDAEDVVQEAAIRLMRNISKIKDLDSKESKGYISVVTRNVCLDKFSEKKSETALDENWQKDIEEDLEESFDIKVDNKEALIYHLKKLSPKKLHILILAFVYDLSTKEISSSLNISQDAVRKRKSRALKELKISLEKGGEFSE